VIYDHDFGIKIVNIAPPSAVIQKPFKISTILHTLKEKLYLKV